MTRTPPPPTTHEPHRTCPLCQLKLPPEHFNPHGRDGRQSYCRKCNAIYHRDYRTWKKHEMES